MGAERGADFDAKGAESRRVPGELPDCVAEERGDGIAAGEQDVEELGADGYAVWGGGEQGGDEVVSLVWAGFGRDDVCVDYVVDKVWGLSVLMCSNERMWLGLTLHDLYVLLLREV